MHQYSPAPAPVLLRPMDIGEVLDTSFKVFRFAWKPMAMISLINAVPMVLFTGYFQSVLAVDTGNPSNSLLLQSLLRAGTGDWRGIATMISIYVGYILLYILLVPLVNGALATAIWDVVLGSAPTAGNALRRAGRRYLGLLGTSVLKGILALLLLGLPIISATEVVSDLPPLLQGLLTALLTLAMLCGQAALFMYTGFTTHAVVLERVGGGPAAMKRSFRLIRGRFWPLLGLALVFYAMISVLSGLVSLVVTIPTGIAAAAAGQFGQVTLLQGLGSAISQMVVMPLLLIGHTLAYFDTRVRKEGLDLELIALAQRQSAVPPS